MPDWKIAVEEADETLKMTVLERKQNLTFVYEDPLSLPTDTMLCKVFDDLDWRSEIE